MNNLIKKIIKKFNGMGNNNKNVFSNVVAAFGIKGIALLISLFTMPAYMRYFNDQLILGLWFTILSVLSWILTFDLGIGNGLRNHLVSAFVENDDLKVKKLISSAYITISGVILIISIIAISIFSFVDWNVIFNIDECVVPSEVLGKVVGIVFLGIMLQFILKLITSVLYAMQRSAIINLLTLFNSIIILVYVLLAPSSDIVTNLTRLAWVHILAVNGPLMITGIYIFNTRLKGCFPKLRYFKLKYAQDVMKLGGIFFWVQIMYMVLTTTNEFLITWLIGPEMVVEYQIYNKLFTLIGTFFALGLTPIWSAVTKALAEQDYIWIKKLYNTLKLLTVIAVIFEFVMIPFLQLGINLWLGDEAINVNYVYAIVFAISGSLMIWNGVISSIANGIGRLRTQTICFTIGAIIKIPIAIILVNITGSWIGVIAANIIAMGSYYIAEPIVINKFIKSKLVGGKENV